MVGSGVEAQPVVLVQAVEGIGSGRMAGIEAARGFRCSYRRAGLGSVTDIAESQSKDLSRKRNQRSRQ